MAKNKYIKCMWFLPKNENILYKDLCIADEHRKDGHAVECLSVQNCKYKEISK